jgi:hypothetical protein
MIEQFPLGKKALKAEGRPENEAAFQANFIRCFPKKLKKMID